MLCLWLDLAVSALSSSMTFRPTSASHVPIWRTATDSLHDRVRDGLSIFYSRIAFQCLAFQFIASFAVAICFMSLPSMPKLPSIAHDTAFRDRLLLDQCSSLLVEPPSVRVQLFNEPHGFIFFILWKDLARPLTIPSRLDFGNCCAFAAQYALGAMHSCRSRGMLLVTHMAAKTKHTTSRRLYVRKLSP